MRPKENPVRSEAYRRLVAALPCGLCHIQGYTQVAHGDEGKGIGIKTSDLTCFPACGPRPGDEGCHAGLNRVTRAERRLIAFIAAQHTQLTIFQSGNWPANLPIPEALQEVTP